MKRKFQITAQGDGAMVFDKSRGIYFQVNEVGLILIKGIVDGKSNEQLITEIENTFSIDHTQAKADVSSYLEQLHEIGLV